MKHKLITLAFLLIACVAAPAGDAEVDLLNARIDKLETSLGQVTQLAMHLQGLVQQSKKNIGLVGLESVDGNSVPAGDDDDEKVAITSTNTADYIGAYSTDGVLRTDASIGYTNGGDYVTLSVTNYIDQNFYKWVTNAFYGAVLYNSLFDITAVKSVAGTFTIRGGAYAAAIAGDFKTVSSYNGTVSANAWVYLTVERDAGTAVISAGATPPAPDDDTEIFPLWYLPWSGGITVSGILDYRYTKHWVAGS